MNKMKVLKKILILASLVSFCLIVNFYNTKKYTYNNNSTDTKEILNYDLRTSFGQNGEKIPRANLITNNVGSFDYDIKFNLKGTATKFKIILLINYIPQNFSMDNDLFSTEKDIVISPDEDIFHNFKLQNKIDGFSVCNFICIPYDIQKDPSNVNCIPFLSGIINNTQENIDLFKDKNIITLTGENISDSQNFNLLINHNLIDGKLSNQGTSIKCKVGEKLTIPILGNLKDNSDCNYSIFLNNQIIKFNDIFSKSIKTIQGNVFSDTISIDVPTQQGKYILWGFIHYNLYGQELPSGISSDNFIILEVE